MASCPFPRKWHSPEGANNSRKPHYARVAAADPGPLSADFPFEKKRIAVNGSEMAYIDEGDGPVDIGDVGFTFK